MARMVAREGSGTGTGIGAMAAGGGIMSGGLPPDAGLLARAPEPPCDWVREGAFALPRIGNEDIGGLDLHRGGAWHEWDGQGDFGMVERSALSGNGRG
ncbi:MAG: hypothetical protein QM690_04115 [Sphingobium sp.]